MSTPADRLARPGLTAAEFLAAVSHYELNPDLSADASRLEQQLHQGLGRCAGLAARLAHGSLKGQRLPTLYLPLAPEIRAVHDTVRGLQTRLRQARKEALKTDALAPLAWGETSATFQLARLALRIVVAVGDVGESLAEAAWVQQLSEQASEYPDDRAEEEDEEHQHEGRGETDSAPIFVDISEEVLAEWGIGVDVPAALASAAAASQLRELFGVRFVFPDSALLLRDARIELMELDALPKKSDPAPTTPCDETKAPQLSPGNIDARIYELVQKRPEVADWTQRRVAKELGCCQATVSNSKTWKGLLLVRQQGKLGREGRGEKPTGSRRKHRPL